MGCLRKRIRSWRDNLAGVNEDEVGWGVCDHAGAGVAAHAQCTTYPMPEMIVCWRGQFQMKWNMAQKTCLLAFTVYVCPECRAPFLEAVEHTREIGCLGINWSPYNSSSPHVAISRSEKLRNRTRDWLVTCMVRTVWRAAFS